MRFKRTLRPVGLLCFMMSLCLPEVVDAAEPESATTPDSLAAYSSSSSPFSLPRVLWNALVYPVERFTIYSEQTQLSRRLSALFTNKAGTFGLRPQVQLGGETGSGGGLGLFIAPTPDAIFQMSGIYAGKRGQRVTASLDDAHAGPSGRMYVRFAGEFLNTHNEAARINGPLDDDTRQFSIRRSDAVLSIGWRPNAGRLEAASRNVYVEGVFAVAYRYFRDRVGSGGLPDVGSTPEALALRGLGEPMQFGRIGMRMVLDSRDYQAPFSEPPHVLYGYFPGEQAIYHEGRYHPRRNTSYPESGGLVVLEGDYSSGTDDVQFVRGAFEAQAFLSLGSGRVLAARGRVEKLHAVDGGMVPFPDLRTLGGSLDLRGYRRGYFRGLGTLVFNIEYRYPIWDTWNAYLFVDEGQVFDAFGDLTTDGFVTSFGGGLTFRSADGLVGKVQVGHSVQEKALFGLVFGQSF